MHGLPAPVAQASRQVVQAPVWARTLRGAGAAREGSEGQSIKAS